MARVNRTTGFFLVLGVLILLGTGVGAYFLSVPNAAGEMPVDVPATIPDVHGRANVDVPSRVSNPSPQVPAGIVSGVEVKEGDFVEKGKPLYRLDDTAAKDKLA